MKSFLVVFLVLILFSCSTDRTDRNPYLQDVGFKIDLNLTLPSYSDLQNTGNAVYVSSQGVGIRGIFVMNINGEYLAFEASCPNHAPNNCSTMELNQDQQNVTCSCDDYQYNLFTGQFLNRPDDGKTYHDMLYYQASRSGNVVTVRN